MDKKNAQPPEELSPFAINNVRMFIAFRVFFNSRFYYPIFTILFLDFGLTLAQFSILNTVWAATIALAEVPSGALADIIGRRKLLIFAAVSMVVEISILCFVPRSIPQVLFTFFIVNRILSGLAEAAASGADEAIAYDALLKQGMENQWGRVLEFQMRMRSLSFIITMTAGAAIYDPQLVNGILSYFHSDIALAQETTMRFPLYLTLVLAFLTLIAALSMKENKTDWQKQGAGSSHWMEVKKAFSLILEASGWILKMPFVLSVIMFGMLFDGLNRVAITLASQYYRMIDLPEASFGIIGSALGIMGLFIPRLALKLAEKKSPSHSVWVTAGLILSGLGGMAFFWPIAGLVPAFMAFGSMYMTGFFVSYYINQKTPSDKRATVLSFKGLAFNVSYGFLGILYAALLNAEKSTMAIADQANIENVVFKKTFFWFPLTFAACFVLVYLFSSFILRRSKRKTGQG